MRLDVWLGLLGASLHGQLVYRRSFVLEIVGRFFSTIAELGAVVVLMGQVGELGGFARAEILYLYGVASLSLALAEIVTDGMNDMPELVRMGTFDGLLVRPAPTLVQVLGRRCRLDNLGRAAQGSLALMWGLWLLPWDPGALEVAMVGVNVLGGVAVYAAIFVVEGATAIFTVQGAEGFNAFTYGGVEMTQYPVSIYPRWLRTLFLWIVPVGFVSYFPALVVLGHPDALHLPPWLPYLTPLVAGLFVLAAVRYWTFAVSRYRSTGS